MSITKNLNCALVLHNKLTSLDLEFPSCDGIKCPGAYVSVKSKFPIPVVDEHSLDYSADLDLIVKDLRDYIANLDTTITCWEFYIAYAGRCWYLTEGLENNEYKLGYVERPSEIHWALFS